MIPGGLTRWALARPGACPHGFSLPAQSALHDCTPVAPNFAGRDTGQQQASAAHPEDRARVEAAIRQLAASGRPFSANECRPLHGVSGPVVGAAFTALRQAGVIRRIGYEPSTDEGTHGHPVAVWEAA